MNNALLAAVIGAVAFAALFLPGVVWQYRRFGRLSFARLLELAAVCLYAAALLTYTLLPLPERSVGWCRLHARGMNLRPFVFIDAILVALVAGTTAVGLRVATLLFLEDVSEAWIPLIVPAAIVSATSAVFVWPAWNHLAASVGQTVVWLTPKWRHADGTLHDGSRLRRVIRSLVVPASWLIPMFLAPFGMSSPFIWLLPLVVPLSVIMVPFTRTHRSFSGWLTGAQMVDIRAEETDKALPVH